MHASDAYRARERDQPSHELLLLLRLLLLRRGCNCMTCSRPPGTPLSADRFLFPPNSRSRAPEFTAYRAPNTQHTHTHTKTCAINTPTCRNELIIFLCFILLSLFFEWSCAKALCFYFTSQRAVDDDDDDNNDGDYLIMMMMHICEYM